jgi:hypothetical protein
MTTDTTRKLRTNFLLLTLPTVFTVVSAPRVSWAQSAATIPSAMVSVANISALSTQTPAAATVVVLAGYDQPGDGGGGIFVWDGADAVTRTDGGTVFANSGAPAKGRWKRLNQDAGINVRWFGAKGDGVTDDGPAIQAAIDSAESSFGGTVYFPKPSLYYKIDRTLVITPSYNPITLRGEGKGCTTMLVWSRDLGAGHYALRYATEKLDIPCNTVIEHLSFRGPKNSAPLGTSPSQMYGVQMGSKTRYRNLAIDGFKAGLVLTGDHNSCEYVSVGGNYYGLYQIYSPTQGDHYFANCDFAGCFMASIGVAPDRGFVGATFYTSTLGFSPYAFYKEAGGAPETFLAGIVMNSSVAECVGNGMIFDQNTAGVSFVSGSKFGPTSFDDTYRITKFKRTAIVDARNIYQCEFHFGDIAGMPQFRSGDDAYIITRGYQFEDNVITPGKRLADHVAASGKPLLFGTAQNGTNGWRDVHGRWEATNAWISQTLPRFALAQTEGNGNAQLASGTKPVLGVSPLAQKAGTQGWILIRGVTEVLVNSPVRQSDALTPSAVPGRVETSSSPGTHMIGGYARTAQNSAGGTASMEVQPKMGASPR